MSIRKISEELGLSSATVSWILSGQGEARGFKEQTIKRVQDYARSINYSPNLVARNLSKGSTRTIGVVIPYINDIYFASIVQEIETKANKHNYGLTICSSGGDENRELKLVEMLLNQRVDGVILASANSDGQAVKLLQDRKCPCVLLDRRSRTMQTNYVTIDNFQSGRELTLKMAEQGARHIAIVTSDTHLGEMQDRLDGYKVGLREAGLQFNEELVIDVHRLNYEQRWDERIESLLKAHPEIDGIFFTTHYLALSCIKYFVDRGIDYNSKYKMASIYNFTWLKLLAPNINMARVLIEDIATETVEILCNNIKDKDMPHSQIVINNIIL